MTTQYEAVSIFINNEPNRWIVKVKGWKGETVADCGTEGEASARMIAAALNTQPDLLSAARWSLVRFTRGTEPNEPQLAEIVDMLRAAIAKAEKA